ncbi:MAG TPA: phosphoglycerate kinase [Chloroflexi bacterium]|nr:phosphoglycerate kinase [Chloroflexota bacterium]
MNKKTIRDVDLKGKRVLVRVDFNVPLKDGKVADDTRIEAAIPTLKAILEQHPRAVILMSHLGRPKGERKPEFSLRPVVPVLAEKLGVDVAFAEDCVGEVAEQAVAALPEGGVLLLENTRFHPEERKNDPEFARQLAKLGDIYVNDAFGSAHRAHASTEGVAHYLPAVAGLLMEKEIEFLSNAIESPRRPFVAILGGAKISDKIGVIENLLNKADRILIGGGMANTFAAAQGIPMGDSLVEADALETAKSILSKAGDKLVLPVDLVIADTFDENANTKVVPLKEGVPEGWRALDIGAETVELFKKHLAEAMTVVWNGPMGVFEMAPFAKGTFAIAEVLAGRAAEGATVIIGGGDSASAIKQAGLADKVTHVSTGGGASLEMLEGKVLPGLAALDDK